MMDLGLKGKKAVIAASSKGIGFAIVQALLDEGAFVLMNGRNSQTLANSHSFLGNPDNLKSFAGDVIQEEVCRDLIAKASNEFGGLDILVTNTGGPVSGKFESLSNEQWDDAISKCLKSHVHLIESALPYLKKSLNPSILTLTSFPVKQPIPNLILSNSVRAATAGLTKSLANELGEYGIRVNSLLPGWTRTDRVNEIMQARTKTKNTSIEQEIAIITKTIPLARMAYPEEIGKAAAFLVSPAASYITGVMLSVDGGINQGLF
jgi:3-oxoacyl-[acyl-carrier protein] reductase